MTKIKLISQQRKKHLTKHLTNFIKAERNEKGTKMGQIVNRKT